ncbi:hypothetical protein SLS60_010817 [Paraconiothyrium brasiliense]|uniref:Uncharacterized protein n=1 Tax=Paraconiothyrium brasiliense TaxID=300254 RepID=A0ABR3QM28_9PLEO
MSRLSLRLPNPVTIGVLALVSACTVVYFYKQHDDMNKHLAASERGRLAEKKALTVKLINEKHELELKILDLTHELEETKLNLGLEKSVREIQEKENKKHEALHQSAAKTVEKQDEQIRKQEAFRQSAKEFMDVQQAQVRSHEAALTTANQLLEAYQQQIRELQVEVARLREGDVTPPPSYHT